MVGPQQISFEEVALLFNCQEHSVFHSYHFNECSLFLELRLAFDFRLDLCLDLVQYSKNHPICRLISQLIMNHWVSDKITAYRSDLSPRPIYRSDSQYFD
jgi:hypothetical protein